MPETAPMPDLARFVLRHARWYLWVPNGCTEGIGQTITAKRADGLIADCVLIKRTRYPQARFDGWLGTIWKFADPCKIAAQRAVSARTAIYTGPPIRPETCHREALTRRDARASAARLSRSEGCDFAPVQCSKCNAWHVDAK